MMAIIKMIFSITCISQYILQIPFFTTKMVYAASTNRMEIQHFVSCFLFNILDKRLIINLTNI